MTSSMAMRPAGASRRLTNWYPLAAWAGLLWYLSLIPLPGSLLILFSLPHGDKVGHMVAYGILAGLCFRVMAGCTSSWIESHASLVTILAVSSFGLFCDWCQMYVPYRSTDMWDIASNSVGVCLAIVIRRFTVETIGTTR